jgi:hypothetical protein
VAWSLEDASELQVCREKDAAIEQEKHDRAELANVPATHGFAFEAFVAALLRASSKSPPGPRRLASMSIEMRLKVCPVLASKLMLGTYVAFGS